MIVAKRCLVSGRVQGVFYRASTRLEARKLGVVGHAKNLKDGRVEVLAIGNAAQVDALISWLRQGPPASQVTNVEVVDAVDVELSALPDQFLTG